MKHLKFLSILLIFVQLTTLFIYAQDPQNLKEEQKIIGIELIEFDKDITKEIQEKGFAIKSTKEKQIYSPYLKTSLPLYVTADAMLQTLNTLYLESLSKAEEVTSDKYFIFFKMMSERMIGGLSIDPPIKIRAALEKNLLVFQLLTSLLTKEKQSVSLNVQTELALINSAKQSQYSPILGVMINYHQFIVPKGLTEKRARLFQALTWLKYWQMNLDNELELTQTFLLAQEFAADERLLAFWKESNIPLDYFFGKVEGLSIESFISPIKYILGTTPVTSKELSEEQLKTFQRLATRINSQNQSFKTFGERILLKERLTKEIGKTGEIVSIDFSKVYNLENLKNQNLKLREALLSWQEKNANSYPSQLIDCYRALLIKRVDGRVPRTLSSTNWESMVNKAVNINWLIYQSSIKAPNKITEITNSSKKYHEDFHGYVEPNVNFFLALTKISNSLQNQLLKINIFVPEIKEFISVSKTLEQIVQKELAAINLSEGEIDLLENFGEILAKLNFVNGNYNSTSIDQSFIDMISDEIKRSKFSVGIVETLFIRISYQDNDYLCQGGLTTYFELEDLGKMLLIQDLE